MKTTVGEAELELVTGDITQQQVDAIGNAANARLGELNQLAEDPSLWDDPNRAQGLMKERQRLESSIGSVRKLTQELDDNIELIELGEMEDDAEVIADAEKSIAKINKVVARQQSETLLSGEAAGNDSYVEINAGAGGTESNDWANINFFDVGAVITITVSRHINFHLLSALTVIHLQNGYRRS